MDFYFQSGLNEERDKYADKNFETSNAGNFVSRYCFALWMWK